MRALTLALGLLTLGASQAQAQSTSHEIERHIDNAIESLEKYASSVVKGCSVPTIENATEEIDAANSLLKTELFKMGTTLTSLGSMRVEASKNVDRWAPKTGDLSLRIANIYLKRGCLDEADVAFRDVLSVYAGVSYTSIRERAKIGIDDVREARRR